ncbi:MAG: cytochrome c biogenesis protein CcsA [Planctomycetota bacterium]|jgi:cytochrome c-type biogenesis protein CcmF
MAQLGHFALLIAFVLSSWAMPADLLGKWRGSAGLIRSGRDATIVSFVCLTAAVIILVIVLIRGDSSIAYVARHSSHTLSTWHKISALWAGACGSLLLWLWMQAGFVVIVFGKCREDNRAFFANARVAANLVCVFFLIALTFKTNPFAASEAAVPDGAGLDLRLQHPLAALHPPVLLVGYAVSAVPFAWSFGWLKWDAVQGPAPLFKQVRNWVLSAWLFLTVGAILSAWSASEHLGLTGHWLRDVVPNVSLMPWLPATALLYWSRVYKRNAAAAKWMIVLSLVTFSLCISAAFLTRPGLTSGIRAFPQPGLGKVFTILLIHIWVLAAISSWRRRSCSTKVDPEQPDKTEEIRCDS